MNETQLAMLLQLSDSAFPSGTFSHSFGLETAIAEGRVHGEATLEAWLRTYLFDVLAPLDGAALLLVLRDAGQAQTCDDILTAATFADEVRTANARIAGAVLDTLAAIGALDAALDTYRESIRAGRAAGTPAVALGLAYASLGIDREPAFTAFASSLLAALAAVGTRAIPLGQRATARLLWHLRAPIAEAANVAAGVMLADDLRVQTVSHEIDAMRHRLLDGRLFAS